jgi:hypothetical protein
MIGRADLCIGREKGWKEGLGDPDTVEASGRGKIATHYVIASVKALEGVEASEGFSQATSVKVLNR